MEIRIPVSVEEAEPIRLELAAPDEPSFLDKVADAASIIGMSGTKIGYSGGGWGTLCLSGERMKATFEGKTCSVEGGFVCTNSHVADAVGKQLSTNRRVYGRVNCVFDLDARLAFDPGTAKWSSNVNRANFFTVIRREEGPRKSRACAKRQRMRSSPSRAPRPAGQRDERQGRCAYGSKGIQESIPPGAALIEVRQAIKAPRCCNKQVGSGTSSESISPRDLIFSHGTMRRWKPPLRKAEKESACLAASRPPIPPALRSWAREWPDRVTWKPFGKSYRPPSDPSGSRGPGGCRRVR